MALNMLTWPKYIWPIYTEKDLPYCMLIAFDGEMDFF